MDSGGSTSEDVDGAEMPGIASRRADSGAGPLTRGFCGFVFLSSDMTQGPLKNDIFLGTKMI